jgi:hypothetical protein
LNFQLPYLPEEACFQQAGSSAVEGTSQAVLGSYDQSKVPPSLSLFLKSEKIPALVYIGKGPEYTGASAIFGLFPGPTSSGTYLKSQKGLYSGPSPIQKSPNTPMLLFLVAAKN